MFFPASALAALIILSHSLSDSSDLPPFVESPVGDRADVRRITSEIQYACLPADQYLEGYPSRQVLAYYFWFKF